MTCDVATSDRTPERGHARPTVTVVVPCYRYGRFLPECVGSILGQDGVDVRALIIDDASPDDSADVADALAAADDRVEVRRHAVNRGHIATYNEGLLEGADGEYSVLLSADDMLTPGALRRATAVLAAHPNVALVYGHAIGWQNGRPRPPARLRQTGTTIWRGADWLRIVCSLGHSVVASPEVVVRTSVQQRIGGYRPELPHSGDAEMWMRFAVHGDVAYLKGVDQAYYRTHGDNMTAERTPIVDLHQRKAAYDAIFSTYAGDIARADDLRRSAGRRLAAEALWDACRLAERRVPDAAAIAELRDFAREAYPDADRLPEARGLRLRTVAGPRVCAALRPSAASAARRRLQNRLWWRRWEREGV
jgi:glycosyl transferase family 2